MTTKKTKSFPTRQIKSAMDEIIVARWRGGNILRLEIKHQLKMLYTQGRIDTLKELIDSK